METLEAIFRRKSVREFSPQEIGSKQLEALVKAGMAAPTAINAQPWKFGIVTERKKLDALAEGLPYARMLFEAPAAIVVCGDLQKALTGTDQNYWVQDCAAATENILLAAEAMGLGAVWTAAFPYKDRIKPVRESLKLPEHIVPLNVIPLGYPKGNPQPKDKWKPENVFRNSYE
jgi:nitroreductase